MIRSPRSLRAPLLGLALVALIGVVTIPALAASPSAAPGGDKGNDKGPKPSHQPEVPVTLHGVVSGTKDADGSTTYTIVADGKTVRLEAGPPWFFGDKNPLAPFVGKTVTVTGEQTADEVDVDTVDGVRLRAEGKPPWAGGWKAVGSAHPGWSQDKWDRWQAKQASRNGAPGGAGSGACLPPGLCKEHGPDGSEEPAETPDPTGG